MIVATSQIALNCPKLVAFYGLLGIEEFEERAGRIEERFGPSRN
jgi:hypothetical protein